MAGISLITALEIFTQPDDLQFSVGERGGKWAVAITRGPGHNFKLLLTSEPVFDSSEAAVNAIGEVLDTVCQAATEQLSNPTTFAAQIVNPANQSLDNAPVLTPERRERIMQELREKGSSSTFAHLAPA